MSGSVGQPTQAWMPWVAVKATVGSGGTRATGSTMLGMGEFYNTSGLQNDEFDWDIYLDSVTWKLAVVHLQFNDKAIMTFRFGGTTVGTIDAYNAANTSNNYHEVTGFANATPQAGTFAIVAASKNASSSAYFMEPQSLAWIATSGTYSTPAGTDTPGYTWEWIPWMGYKGTTGWATRTQASIYFGGGDFNSNNSQTQNDQINTDAWLDAGTHTLTEISITFTTMGIGELQLNGSTFASFDWYSGAEVDNVVKTASASIATSGVKNVKKIMSSKNASSSAYRGDSQSIKFNRTGA